MDDHDELLDDRRRFDLSFRSRSMKLVEDEDAIASGFSDIGPDCLFN